MSDSDGGGVIQPLAKGRVGRQTHASSPANTYHPSKSQLIDWVNQTLLLGITRLEEFASGAVFCQMMDAYYEDIVPIHRVNFHAREEYEFVPNYKILQGVFTDAEIAKDIDVQKLMRGSPSECLELLQFMHKLLKGLSLVPAYDPCERRLRSVKGGTDRIPMPYWMHSHFDIYGRPEGTKLEYDRPYDGYIEAGRRSRASRTPGPSVPSSARSARHRPHTRTASVDSRNYHTELTAAMREMQGSRRTLQDSTELSISHNRSRTTVAASSRSPVPSHRHQLRHLPGPRGTPPPSPKAQRRAEAESSVYSVNLRAVDNSPRAETSRQQNPPTTAPEEVAEEGLLAVRRCLDALSNAVPNFKTLLEDLGTENDNYAYRGKLRSMKDVINTLLRHNGLLMDNLTGLHSQSPDEWHHAFRGFVDTVEQIQKLETDFECAVHRLTEMETRNPIPRSCGLHMTEEQKRLSDTRAVDSVLRKIGAAQASMDLTLSRDSYPQTQNTRSTPRLQTSESHGEANGTHPTSRVEEKVVVKASEALSPSTSSASTLPRGDYQIRCLHNGDIYKGRYQGPKKNGVGVYQFVNGDVYEGEFVEDRMQGNGVYAFANEGRYEGQWQNSAYEGAGNETFARGSTYRGEYTNGMRDGWGACRYYNGDYYEGQWRHGLREGRGMQQCTEESNYIGDYLAGKRHGYGYYCFPNGDRYLGEYECDIPHGYGIYIFSTGQKYEGQWEQGKKHGWCIYTIETGEMWAGEWVEGKPKWVQGLSNTDENDPRWPEAIVRKVETAWIACRRARDSAREGSARAEDHWRSDGEIQNAIKEAKSKADAAASASQEMRKQATDIASTLDTLAAEKEAAESK